ncbi:MAG: hypothetical protein ABIG92_02715 [Candidatus Omnitrophota bacterium]
MKKIFLCMALALFFSDLYVFNSMASEEAAKKKSKVILPTGDISSSIPSLSPDVTTPSLKDDAAGIQEEAAFTSIDNIPGSPVEITLPVTEVLTNMTEAPDSGNLLGEVIDVYLDKNDYSIVIKDDNFKDPVKLQGSLNSSLVVREGRTVPFSDIKKGNWLSAVYTKEGEISKVHFISIIPEKSLHTIKRNP